MKATDGQPIKKAPKNDTPDNKPPSSKIGADKSPFAAESSKRPYSSAAR
jgi:hypothetical protein